MYWEDDSRTSFINPYNFVRLSDRPVSRELVNGTCSGVIKCKLKTRTPLCLPDEEKRDNSEDPTFVPFFRIPRGVDPFSNTVSIPGSELRGVVRSAMEALNNGCLSVNNNNTLSARHPTPRNPALLHWDGERWELYDATMEKLGCSLKRKPDATRGEYIRIWPSKGSLKTIYYIFTKGTLLSGLTNLEAAVKRYEETLSIYKKNNDNSTYQSACDRVSPKKDSSCFTPCFYETVHSESMNVVYLSPAQISRTVFSSTVDELLGDHRSCSNEEEACEVCQLFGFISDDAQVSSRLRFSDAVCTSKPSFQVKTLKELSSPKTSSVEFYTYRPKEALTWTYDYDVKSYDGVVPERSLLTGSPVVRLRGRKVYLHHCGGDDSVYKGCSVDSNNLNNDAKKRTITTELLETGSTFSFQVYFERLTEEQVKKVAWAICLGENTIDGNHLHKIGHGKPLGLGSAKFVVDSIVYREVSANYYNLKAIDRSALQDMLSNVPYEKDDAFNEYMTATMFNLATDVTGKPLNICYPLADSCEYNENSTASHQWFVANRTIGEGSHNALTPSICYTLPHLPKGDRSGSTLLLPKFTKSSTARVTYGFEGKEEPRIRSFGGPPTTKKDGPSDSRWAALLKAKEKFK